MASIACAQVSMFTVIVGNSFGVDNYMMVRPWQILRSMGECHSSFPHFYILILKSAIPISTHLQKVNFLPIPSLKKYNWLVFHWL